MTHLARESFDDIHIAGDAGSVMPKRRQTKSGDSYAVRDIMCVTTARKKLVHVSPTQGRIFYRTAPAPTENHRSGSGADLPRTNRERVIAGRGYRPLM